MSNVYETQSGISIADQIAIIQAEAQAEIAVKDLKQQTIRVQLEKKHFNGHSLEQIEKILRESHPELYV